MAEPQERLPSHNLRQAAAQMEISAVATPAGVETEEVSQEALAPRVSSPMRDAWRRFRNNWAAMISLITIFILIFAAIFAPFLHTSDPTSINYVSLDQFPSPHHWFGTDGLGRDLYSRMVYGLRTPLIVGIVGSAITTVLGMLLGVTSGYFGGIIDSLLSRFTDLMFAFPAFTLALIIVSLYGEAADKWIPGGAGRILMLTVVFAIVGWPGLMRFIRSLTLSMKEQQFIEAARTCGSSHWTIIRRHLLPNTYGLLLIQASFLVVGFIYNEAILSLFGLGIQQPAPDLGQDLIQGVEHLALNPWEAMIPSAILTLLILAFTFLGDGVRDAVDPRTTE